MAIKVGGTTVIDNSRNFANIQSITFADGSSLSSSSNVATPANFTKIRDRGELLHTLDNPNAYSTSATDYFGRLVAISGNYAIVGAYAEDDSGGTGSGKAYIFNVTTGALVHTLDNPNAYSTSASDFFGIAAAISGNYAIVGAYGEDDSGGTGSGKAYIFNVTTGALVHTLDNPNAYNTSTDDYFGNSVGISGNYAIVGAYLEDDSDGGGSGKAYIFNATTGALVHTLNNPTAYSTPASDYFGWSVAISGNYAIVGAYLEDDAGGLSSGKAYIFNATTGALVHTLNNPTAYGTSAGDYFGFSVGISGNYAIVGANLEDDSGGTESGKAYIYHVANGTLAHTLDNPNAYGTSAGDTFGSSVAIDGNYAIVGAYQEDDSGGSGSGKAYIFNVTTGALIYTLDNPNAYDTSADDRFGYSASISGNYAIVGAYNEDDSGGTQSGKAYIFAVDDTYDVTDVDKITFSNGAEIKSNSNFTNLLTTVVNQGDLIHTLDNPNVYDISAGDYFAHSVSIDGNYAIVGAPREDDVGLTYSGIVYIYNVTTGALLHTLNNPNPTSFSQFGSSVGISGNHAIIYGSGYTYIYNVITGALMHTITGSGGIAISGNYAIRGASNNVYVYNVTTGNLIRTLANPNPSPGGGDNFGSNVAIEGNHCIVSAYGEADSGGNSSGKAHIFNIITGELLHTLNNPTAYGTSASDYFGDSVAISGNYAIVSADFEDDSGGTESGKAYIFNVTTGALVHTLDNPTYGSSASDYFGRSVSISGNYAIVGAYFAEDSGGGGSGKAYIYKTTDGTWTDTTLVYRLNNPNAYGSSVGDTFGNSVSMSGNYVIVGAEFEGDSDGAPSFDASGVAYIFAVKDLTNLDRIYTLVQ